MLSRRCNRRGQFGHLMAGEFDLGPRRHRPQGRSQIGAGGFGNGIGEICQAVKQILVRPRRQHVTLHLGQHIEHVPTMGLGAQISGGGIRRASWARRLDGRCGNLGGGGDIQLRQPEQAAAGCRSDRLAVWRARPAWPLDGQHFAWIPDRGVKTPRPDLPPGSKCRAPRPTNKLNCRGSLLAWELLGWFWVMTDKMDANG